MVFFAGGLAAHDSLGAAASSGKGPPSVNFTRYKLFDCSGQSLIEYIGKLLGLEKTPIVFLTSPAGEAEPFGGPTPEGATIVYEKLISAETFLEIEELLRHSEESSI